MKNRNRKPAGVIFRLLLQLAILMLLPAAQVLAASDYESYIPRPEDTASDLEAKQVFFNGQEWYLISDNSVSVSSGSITLLKVNTIDGVKYSFNGTSYAGSQVKSLLDDQTKEGGPYADVACAILNTKLEDVGVDRSRLYILNLEEAIALSSNEVRKSDRYWWLRTPIEGSTNKMYYVHLRTGEILTEGNPITQFSGVRPALRLDLSRVLFSPEDREFTVRPYSIYIPEDDDNDQVLADKQVTYNGSAWYIVKDHSTAADSGYITLHAVSGDEEIDLTLSDVRFSPQFRSFTLPGEIAGLVLEPEDPETEACGDAIELTATVLPEDVSNKNVKWYAQGNGITIYSDPECKRVMNLDSDTGIKTVYVKVTVPGRPVITVKSSADTTKSTSATLTVNKARATIIKEPTPNDRYYDGETQPLLNDDGETNSDGFLYAVRAGTTPPDPDQDGMPSFLRTWKSKIPTGSERGVYSVWVKAAGNDDYRESQPVRVLAQIEYPVTFQVVGGSWDDGTKEDKLIPLSRREDEDLLLTISSNDFPKVGHRPDPGYKAGGSWDPPMPDEIAVNGSKTYTFTYDWNGSLSANVTFRVVNGSWDDGEKDDRTLNLCRSVETPILTLSENDIPAVGSKPDDGYLEGSWDKTPVAGEELFEDVTYTYTYKSKGRKYVPDLKGLSLGGKSAGLILYLPETVSYNGRIHVSSATKLTEKQAKKRIADMDIFTEGYPAGIGVDYKYKKTKDASDAASITAVLYPDKSSAAYKSLDKEGTRNLGKEIKKVNKALKNKKNKVLFTISPLNLGSFTLDKGNSSKDKLVYVRSDNSADTLTVLPARKSVTAKLSGHEFKIPKKEYKIEASSGRLVITGKNKNLSGTLTADLK